LIHPGVELKTVEGDALLADWDFGQKRAHFGVETVSVHAEVVRRVPEPDQSGQQPGKVVTLAVRSAAVAHGEILGLDC
jgi:hypothetical protein